MRFIPSKNLILSQRSSLSHLLRTVSPNLVARKGMVSSFHTDVMRRDRAPSSSSPPPIPRYQHLRDVIQQMEEDEETHSQGWRNALLVLLMVSIGMGVGFYALAPAVVNAFGIPDDDDDDDGDDAKTKDKKNDGDGDDDENSETAKSSLEQKFLRFANHTDPETGELFMTLDAFMKSLISAKGTGRPNGPSWIAYPRESITGKLLVDANLRQSDTLSVMFAMADADSDGLISFDEYSTFFTLLSATSEQFKIAFELFDKDNDGSLDLDEFKSVISANNREPRANIDYDNNVIVKYFFGAPGTWKRRSKRLTFAEFSEFLHMLKEELLRQEFSVHDVEGNGLISVESFSELMTGTVHFNSVHVPEFKRNLNLLKTRGYLAPTGRIDYEVFRAFHEMSQHADDIGLAIQLYTRKNKKMNKDAFVHILKSVVHLNIPDKVTDLVFATFDTNGDGNLEYKEFLNVMARRAKTEFSNI